MLSGALRVQLRVRAQPLQWLSGLVQKTMDSKNGTKEKMDPNLTNNRAAS